MTRREWWATASTPAKLRQVRAAAVDNMSMRDVAIALGTTHDALRCFASMFGVSFARPASPAAPPRPRRADPDGPLALDDAIKEWTL